MILPARMRSGLAIRRTIASLLAATLALGALPSRAAAAPTLRYAWNACDSGIISEPWLGPGFYRQALCVDGLAADVRSIEVVISVGPSVPDAWKVSVPFVISLCEPASAFQYDGNVPGAGVASVPTVLASFDPDLTDPRWRLAVRATYDAATPPDPSVTTGVAHLVFDLSNARVVADAPGECGGAGVPLCFGIAHAAATHADGSVENLALAQDHVRWNDPSNTTQCPGSVPARAGTWGTLKAQYR